ncbi:MAG: aminotransferase class IV, partial [Asticcacaulis sp.]|nr:aminotransferase class IV [Asticcacaulis sp.]
MTKLAEKIWFNGRIVAWEDAQVHVMTHGLHYGTSVFEGIRCYDTPHGPVGFRLADHLRRLEDSARIYGITIPFNLEQMITASKDIIVANNLKSAYWRP